MSDDRTESDKSPPRREVKMVVESAKPGDTIRIVFDTSDPCLSSISPSEVEYTRRADGRFHRVTMFGDPLWFEAEPLVDHIMSNEYVRYLEVTAL